MPEYYKNISGVITPHVLAIHATCPNLMSAVSAPGQGGRHDKNIGRALCSDDDVTKTMTSLLPIFHTKILGGARAPLAPPVATPLPVSEKTSIFTYSGMK